MLSLADRKWRHLILVIFGFIKPTKSFWNAISSNKIGTENVLLMFTCPLDNHKGNSTCPSTFLIVTNKRYFEHCWLMAVYNLLLFVMYYLFSISEKARQHIHLQFLDNFVRLQQQMWKVCSEVGKRFAVREGVSSQYIYDSRRPTTNTG